MATKSRVEWIDLVRAIAILTVLYCHSIDGIYIIQSVDIISVSLISRLFEFGSLFIGRLGVPFFLMITGYLLLDRVYDNGRVRKFWTKNCKNLIICTIIWCIIYAASLHFVTVRAASLNPMEAGTLLFSHMWYMPMIIGMYLSLPFAANALKDYDNKLISQIALVFTIIAFCVPFITTLVDMAGIHNITLQISMGFSGGVYGIYMILGYLVKKDTFKFISSKLLATVTIISFIVTLIFQYYAFIRAYHFTLWYEFPFVMLGSFTLFELISRIKKVKAYSFVHVLSKYSFAVFLIHNLFRAPLLPLVILLPVGNIAQVLVLWVLLIVLSYIAAIIVYRIPKFGKFILYMR